MGGISSQPVTVSPLMPIDLNCDHSIALYVPIEVEALFQKRRSGVENEWKAIGDYGHNLFKFKKIETSKQLLFTMQGFLLTSLAVFLGLSSANLEFSRTVKGTASDVSFYLEFDEGCSSTDVYGSNNCNFKWGQTLKGSMTSQLGLDLEDGSKVDINLKIDNKISLKFTCLVCGQNCTTTIPIVNEPITFPTPDCPIPANSIDETFKQALPSESPTEGVKVTASGTAVVNDQNGKEIVNLKIDSFTMQ